MKTFRILTLGCKVNQYESEQLRTLLEASGLRHLDADHADLPVVVVSTLDRPSDRLAGLESGADAYLTKQGLDVRELVALIHRVGGRG